MRVLITGSSGQIGTNLALKLIGEGHYVFGVDVRPNPWTNKIPTLLQDLGVLHHNFNGGVGAVKYPENFDLVVHLAAHAKVHELVEKPELSLVNVIMLLNALEFCRHNHLPIIYSSSREVYGDIHRYINGDIYNESHADFSYAESPYSAGKIAGEAFVYSYARCYGLPYVVFRFSNVYGRYDSDIERLERVIPLFISKIKKEEAVVIYGLDKILDFTYIDDCVDGIYRAINLLTKAKEESHTINLAYGKGYSLVDLVDYIGKKLKLKPRIIEASTQVGEVSHYVADLTKAKNILGYEPKVSLQEGICRAVDWSEEWKMKRGM